MLGQKFGLYGAGGMAKVVEWLPVKAQDPEFKPQYYQNIGTFENCQVRADIFSVIYSNV
jgi:hypothetical protein